MDKKLVALLSILLLTAGVTFYQQSPVEKQTIQQIYTEWKAEHGLKRCYSNEQDQYRFNVFKANLAKINEHNSLLGKTHEEGVNQFTALTPEEFAAAYLTKIDSHGPAVEIKETQRVGIDINWVSYGAVSPVKNQGSCVASYAFSAVGAIEGISVIYFKTPTEYSVQEVIDCSSGFGNNGCSNGRMDNTFNFATSRGINNWAAYPYAGFQQSCKTSSGIFKIHGYSNVTVGNTVALDNALTGRPISVAVDGQNFQTYRSGIFSNCGTNLSLAVLLVGATNDYYTIKNSWGTSWGENGYIRLRKSGNTCGVANAASYPLP